MSNVRPRKVASLQIALNRVALIDAGTDACCSLSWLIVCSRYEQSFASLSVSGMVERDDGKYDHLLWAEDSPLAAGSLLSISLSSVQGATAISRLQTHEQLEALRTEVNRAEAAGEYDAARAATKVPVRDRSALGLATSSGNSIEAIAAGSIATVICSGNWSRDHRPTEWRLRLWSMPVESTAKGFWQSTAGGVSVAVREA